MRFLMWILPDRLFYADHFTSSARRMFARIGVGFLGFVVGLITIGLIDEANWTDVLAGALLAWGVQMMVWSVASYRHFGDDVRTDLRRNAEIDLLHGRLNHIGAKLGTRSLILDYELEHAVGARMERLAHFAGLDEFREEAHATAEGYEFWDTEALGYPDDGDDLVRGGPSGDGE